MEHAICMPGKNKKKEKEIRVIIFNGYCFLLGKISRLRIL